MKNINGKVLAIVAITTIAWISSASAMMSVETTQWAITATTTEWKVYMWGSANFDESRNGRCEWEKCLTNMPMIPVPPKRPDFTGGEYGEKKAEFYKLMKEWKITEEEYREELKILKEEMKARYKEQYEFNQKKIKFNREEFKADAWKIRKAFSNLSEEVKEKLKELKKEHKLMVSDLINELKNKDLSLEDRESIRNSLKELNMENAIKIKELVSWDEAAEEFMEKREILYKKNFELRKENTEARKEYRGKRDELVKKYKEKFVAKLSSKITKLSTEKLEKVNNRISKMIEKFEWNTKISEEKKDKILAQLISLKEIIDEELINREEVSDEIDLDAIFAD